MCNEEHHHDILGRFGDPNNPPLCDMCFQPMEWAPDGEWLCAECGVKWYMIPQNIDGGPAYWCPRCHFIVTIDLFTYHQMQQSEAVLLCDHCGGEFEIV